MFFPALRADCRVRDFIGVGDVEKRAVGLLHAVAPVAKYRGVAGNAHAEDGGRIASVACAFVLFIHKVEDFSVGINGR
ncbi:hypothetical protein CCP3SC15_300001 [Gammaproteobacteria bacterium]